MRSPRVYYNEIDKNAVLWLRALIKKGLISDGDIDDRSIRDVHPDDLRGYDRWHFFAGIGVWDYALRQARWPEDLKIATASAPCQPFSVAGKQRGTDDDRHLWPDFFRLARAARFPRIMGEQVARTAGETWLDGVRSDLESIGYASGAVVVPACAVDAPHIRQRIYWVAHLADANRSRFGARTSGGNNGSGDSHGRDLSAAHDGGELVYPQIERRGQGRSEPGVRCRRNTASGPDAPGDMADSGCGSVRRNGRASDPESASDVCSDTQQQWIRPDTKPLDATRGMVDAADPYSWWRFLSGPSSSSSANRERPSGEPARSDGGLGHADGERLSLGESVARDTCAERATAGRANDRAIGPEEPKSFWTDHEWIVCHDGKKRRTKSSLPLLVDGTPGRIPLWRGFGNSIVAPLAIEVIKAFLESSEARHLS